MTATSLTPDTIIDTAIALAKQCSWAAFSLTELAVDVGCSLNDIAQFYRSKDDIGEAIFTRADQTMRSLAFEESYQKSSADERLFTCIMVWFEALPNDKALIREILKYKLEPGHFHLQAHGITRISRTVQWFLEVSNRKTNGLKRISDEVAVTSAYLVSFSVFLCDNSAEHAKTKSLLKSLIKKISRGQQFLFN